MVHGLWDFHRRCIWDGAACFLHSLLIRRATCLDQRTSFMSYDGWEKGLRWSISEFELESHPLLRSHLTTATDYSSDHILTV